jgi:AcrR family transcriptional regulator
MSQMKNGSRDSLDPRAQRTRRLLLDAFGVLMRERSFGRITVGDIAARATVNRATFYLHFRDKDALLEEVLRERTRDWLDLAAPVPPSHDPDYLQVLLVGVCEFLARMDRECPRSHKQFDGRLEAHVQADVRARVAAWLALGGSASPHPETLTATVVGAGLYAAAQAWRRDAKRSGAAGFAQRAIPVLLAPLGGDGTEHSAGHRLRIETAVKARSRPGSDEGPYGPTRVNRGSKAAPAR